MTSVSATLSDTAAVNAAPNHPLAARMAAIAFLSYNLTIGCIFGSYSVLMAPIEAKLGITRDLSSLGIPMVLLAIAVTAPIVGILTGRMSIRLLMILGALLLVAGFVVLAVARNAVVFLADYGLLLGPGMCLLATMLPPILVTRWYNARRGRALGFVNMPILAAGISPLVAVVLTKHGLAATYIMLAALMALLLPVLLFVVDYPPDTIDQNGEDTATKAASPGITVGELLRTGSFWMISLPFAAIAAGATVLAAHIVPMTMDWGLDSTKAASLLTASSLGGMAGSVIFGWIADRLGGALTLVIVCVNNAILWTIMLLQPPYAMIALLVTLMGLNTAAVVAVVSMAFSERFGHASFGRVFGMSNLVNLPVMLLCVPAAGHVYVRTGSYAGAVAGLVGFTLLGAMAALKGRLAEKR